LPDATQLHPSTINVLLDAAMRVTVPDVVTPPIAWLGPNRETERFAFTRVAFEYPIGGTRRDAWIYTAERSPHRLNMALVQILAPWIDGNHTDSAANFTLTDNQSI
jgi:hypothetical protein